MTKSVRTKSAQGRSPPAAPPTLPKKPFSRQGGALPCPPLLRGQRGGPGADLERTYADPEPWRTWSGSWYADPVRFYRLGVPDDLADAFERAALRRRQLRACQELRSLELATRRYVVGVLLWSRTNDPRTKRRRFVDGAAPPWIQRYAKKLDAIQMRRAWIWIDALRNPRGPETAELLLSEALARLPNPR